MKRISREDYIVALRRLVGEDPETQEGLRFALDPFVGSGTIGTAARRLLAEESFNAPPPPERREPDAVY